VSCPLSPASALALRPGAACTIIRTLRLAETGEMLLYLAMSRILLRRLTPKKR
jgi:hypothetical protein